MITTIHCKHCDNSTNLSISFTFTLKHEHCSKCHQSTSKKVDFHFCDLKCFQAWLKANKIFEKGIPCQDCHETGFLAGFQSNGKCQTCNGTKRIKNIVMVGYQEANNE